MHIKKRSIFQSLNKLFSGDCVVNLDLAKEGFPNIGLYPPQAEMVRGVFFPGKSCVNKKLVLAKQAKDKRFDMFFNKLVEHKQKLGNVSTKSTLMQAVTTLTMVLQQKGGGFKIPQSVKNYFIEAVGQGEFDQDLVNKLAGEEDWDTNYRFMLERYVTKHKAEMSIRQFVKAAQKKK